MQYGTTNLREGAREGVAERERECEHRNDREGENGLSDKAITEVRIQEGEAQRSQN